MEPKNYGALEDFPISPFKNGWIFSFKMVPFRNHVRKEQQHQSTKMLMGFHLHQIEQKQKKHPKLGGGFKHF